MSLPDITDFPVPPDRAEEGSDFVTALTTWIGGMNDAVESVNEFKDALQEAVPALANSIPASVLSNAGDIIYGLAAATPANLAIGTNGKTLRVVSGLPSWADTEPGVYARDARFAAKTVSVAADRYVLLSPSRMLVDVGGVYLSLSEQQSMSLADAANWDTTPPDAATRAGKDYSVYAVLYAGVSLKILISANATYPTGYSTTTSRKLGGFHCLCASVGTISGHPLTGYVTGDILPASVWDLKHRPMSAPEGMVYVAGVGKWVDIYLASVSGGALVSAYGGTCADGGSSPAFHWYKFSQWFGAVGKRMLTQTEFVAASLGSNQGTNIAGSADPGTTGGKSDTAGRRMISNVGCEDCCGNLWQWGEEAGAVAGTNAYKSAFDGNDSGVAGQSYQEPTRAVVGGPWSGGAYCGSRGSLWAFAPLYAGGYCGSRGVADAIEEI